MSGSNLVKESPGIAILMIVISFIVVLFIPFGIQIDLGPGPDSLVSIFWEIPLQPAWYTIRFFTGFQYYFLFCFFRIFVLICFLFLIFGKFNWNFLIPLAVISELIPLALSIPAFFILNPEGDNLYHIIVPIPILLAYIWMLMHLIRKKDEEII